MDQSNSRSSHSHPVHQEMMILLLNTEETRGFSEHVHIQGLGAYVPPNRIRESKKVYLIPVFRCIKVIRRDKVHTRA